MKPQQYVIVKKGDEKPLLARVSTVNASGTIHAVVEKDVQFKSQTMAFHKKDVKVNLGMTPLPGKAYGFDLNNLFKKTITHDFWGNIHFFISPEKEVRKLLKESLDRTAKKIDKMGLQPFTNLFETEIRAKSGKYAGMYAHSKDEAKPHRVWYAPEHALDASDPKEYMEYIIYHEFGHVVRYNGVLRNKLRNRWLRLYQKTIAPVQVDKVLLGRMLKDLDGYDETENSFSSVFKTLNEDNSPRIPKAIMQWLKQTHKIGSHELEVMWRASKLKDIEKFWPDHMIDTHDLKPTITDYATKNVEELFAECFSFYCQGKKLPEKFQELMEESLSTAKADVGA